MTGGAAVPYCGPMPVPADIWMRWNLDPLLGGAFLAACLAWWWQGGRQSDARLLGASLAALAIAFVSPLCALTTALFAARSLHHIVVLGFAAPLFALSLPSARRPAMVPALIVSTGILWLWHVPAIYAGTFESVALYWAMQAALFGSFVWFWRSIFSAAAPPFASLLAIGAGAAQMGFLAAILTLAPRPLYEAHLVAPHAWGLTSLSDQQLGGLLMWVPTFFLYGVFAFAALRRFAREAAE
jgi:putative membrane protein